MRHLSVVALALSVVCLLVGRASSNGQNDGEGDQITVAPHTIVLGSEVDAVTVHSNLPIDSVVTSTVTLNGVEPIGVWEDNRGHLVTRFALAALIAGVEPPAALTLTLTGDLVGGGTFEASDTVRVVRCKK